MLRRSTHGLFQKRLVLGGHLRLDHDLRDLRSNAISRRSSMANVASSVPSAERTVEPCARSKFSISATSGRSLVYERVRAQDAATNSATRQQAEHAEDDAWSAVEPGPASRIGAPGAPTRCGSPARRRWSSGHSGGRVARKPAGPSVGVGMQSARHRTMTARTGRPLRLRIRVRILGPMHSRSTHRGPRRSRLAADDRRPHGSGRAALVDGGRTAVRTTAASTRPHRASISATSCSCDDAPPPAGGPPAHRPRRRCDRPRRRPERPIRGAQLHEREVIAGLGRRGSAPRSSATSSFEGANAGDDRQQPRLDRAR